MIEIIGKHTTAKVMIDDIEPTCYQQINTFVNHSTFSNPVAIMPDTHAGKGSVIGFTMKMTEKVIPNVVGVDIGCGTLSFNIGKELNYSKEEFDQIIRSKVPFGINIHDKTAINMEKEFPWHETNVLAKKFAVSYRNHFGCWYDPPKYDMNWFMNKVKLIDGNLRRVVNSLATLGGGNHFIEIGIDLYDEYWITIHTGSRNFGKRICDYWQHKAIHNLKKISKEKLEKGILEIRQKYQGMEIKKKIKELRESLGFTEGLNSNGLEWLEGEDAAGYLFDMIFAQKYAEVNRTYIGKIILENLKSKLRDSIETVHNFIDFNDFIIRKGSIRSYQGERMIIPFNMRDGILICEGKSNENWNYSAPHGAGRVLSRSQARKQLKIEDFKKTMEGIYSTSVCNSTIDEAPGAYKDSRIIEEAIQPTAKILNRIKPIHNMKDK